MSITRRFRATVDDRIRAVEVDRDVVRVRAVEATPSPDAGVTNQTRGGSHDTAPSAEAQTASAADGSRSSSTNTARRPTSAAPASPAAGTEAAAHARPAPPASMTEGARAFIITPLDATTLRVRADGAAAAHAVQSAIDKNGAVWTFIDGDVFRVELEDADRGARARRASGDEGLSAPMPATVIRLLVAAGDRVAAGDTLLLLEAMKMELPIRAPRAARVTALHCKAGDLVQPGVALVDLDADTT